MHELTLQLPEDVLDRLQNPAESRHIPVVELVQAVIENYLDDEDEPTNEAILKDLRDAMRDALAGKGRPDEEVMAEIRMETRAAKL